MRVYHYQYGQRVLTPRPTFTWRMTTKTVGNLFSGRNRGFRAAGLHSLIHMPGEGETGLVPIACTCTTF